MNNLVAIFKSKIRTIVSHKHFKHGAPFFILIGAGAFVLKEVRTVRYDDKINPKANKFLTKEEAFGDLVTKTDKIRLQPARSAEEELDLTLAKTDLDSWENKRGPRPWEGGKVSSPEHKIMKKPSSPAPTVDQLLGSRRP